jgi:outer membrane protein OmpA-like peptidoglycan-associated protein
MKLERKKNIFIVFIFVFLLFNKSIGQTDKNLQIIEDFENDSPWIWKPWVNMSNKYSIKTSYSNHSGKFGLRCMEELFIRTDLRIGTTGQVISWWIRFEQKTNAYCGFGTTNENRFFLCLSPETNTLHFSDFHADRSNTFRKSVVQKYKLYNWYRAEIVFNTSTNVTGKLYASDGVTLINSITMEIPNLSPNGISFKGYYVHLDDIRGGTRMKKDVTDSFFIAKLGEPVILENIVFQTNKSVLLDQSFSELEKLVLYLKLNPNSKINLVGYTDNFGNEESNKQLSQARAKAVSDYLISHGINKGNISYKGMGSLNPIASNYTEEGRRRNRRVECIISL